MNAGISERGLLLAEKELQMDLPKDFKYFYQVYNGQNEFADYLFDMFYLCSLDQIVSYWKALRDNERDFLDNQVEADHGIRPIWCGSKWVPFASTADGHFLCMDFNPTDDGTMGQIITVWSNSPERELVAKSFRSFIETYANNLENAIYIYDNCKGHGSIVRADGKPMI